MPRSLSDFEIAAALEEFGMDYSSGHKPGVFINSQEGISDPSFYSEVDENSRIVRLGNPDLPVHQYKDTIIETVRENPVTIIEAETGAGKSTQTPQFLYEDGYSKIYITQPRRPAARNVFMRIRDEISEVRGRFIGEDLVSYQTAGERDGPEDAPIKVTTDGLQLVWELHGRGVADNEVVIIDEAHEWNSNIEVLVAWTKRALKTNPNLKVVIMSASINTQQLADYYADVCPVPPPIIKIPGRTFNVEKSEKPESTVVEEVLAITRSLLNEEGELPEGPCGILAFKPGKREIYDAIAEVEKRLPPKLSKIVKVFPLHSKLSPREQQAAVEHYPGSVKIVFATDVAQTSLTIPDIKYVVDSGYQRRIELDAEGTRGLVLNPISRADRDQRAGRTGRVADGHYILTRLNEQTPHVANEDRDEYPVPEMLRTDVARHALRLKTLGLDIAEFDMYHNASTHIIELANTNLTLLGAFDENGDITPIGMKMDEYPVCTSSARIMVEAERYRESTRAYLAAIVAAKELGGLQYFAHNVGKKWLELTEEDTSDLLVQLDIFIAIQDMTYEEIKAYDLDISNVERAKEQYVKIAQIAHASVERLVSPSPEEREDIRRCIAVGFLPSIYTQDGEEYVHSFNAQARRRELSNRSLVGGLPAFIIGDPYNIELQDGEETIRRQCIENVTTVTPQILGSIATKYLVWKPEGFLMREGKFKQRERQYLFDVDLGLVQEVPVTPSPQLRRTILEFSYNNPGAAQKELRALKKELERLAHLAKDPIPRLTHDRIMELVDEAAPEDITNPSTIEDNLRAMLLDPERELSIDDFVSPSRREVIINNAPVAIEIDGEIFKIKYRNRKPIVSNYSNAQILALSADTLYLEDGREILFTYRNDEGRSRTCKLSHIKRLLSYDNI